MKPILRQPHHKIALDLYLKNRWDTQTIAEVMRVTEAEVWNTVVYDEARHEQPAKNA